jgi:ATP phosphoribosyltransferase regulatory subunit
MVLAYVAGHHTEKGAPSAGQTQTLTALGPVFRQPLGVGEAGEFVQAGFERFASSEIAERADAALIGDTTELCLSVLDQPARQGLQIELGDAGLIAAVLEALGLDRSQQSLVRRLHAKPAVLSDALLGCGLQTALISPDAQAAGRLSALIADMPTEKAGAVLTEVYALAGLEPVGGRSAAEIAARVASRAKRSQLAPLSEAATRRLLDLLELHGPLAEVSDKAARLAREIGANDAADRLLARTAELERIVTEHMPLAGQSGTNFLTLRVRAGFGSRFSYYDGLLFTLTSTKLGPARPLAAGGRYDALVGQLSGGRVQATALGAALRLDRLLSVSEGAST